MFINNLKKKVNYRIALSLTYFNPLLQILAALILFNQTQINIKEFC